MNEQKLVVKEKFSTQEYLVTIVKNKSITVHTIITLRAGDMAEYDSYNLAYLDRIKSITDKTITFENGRRLRLEEFCWRNWDFNLDKVTKSNQETMMVI